MIIRNTGSGGRKLGLILFQISLFFFIITIVLFSFKIIVSMSFILSLFSTYLFYRVFRFSIICSFYGAHLQFVEFSDAPIVFLNSEIVFNGEYLSVVMSHVLSCESFI